MTIIRNSTIGFPKQRLRWALLAIASFVLLAGCNRSPDEAPPKAATQVPPAKVTVTLRQEWFPNSNYAGALIAAKDFAAKEGLEIKVQPGSDNIDPIKLVLSGESTFGDGGADKVLAANEKGANLVIVGILNNASPTCFIAKAALNVQSPADFKGKRVGVLAGTSTEYVYRTLLKKEGIPKSSLKEIDAPFDLATFIAGQYDIRPAFIYDEPVSLDLQNIPHTIIRPEKYGIAFLGTVYFTTKKFATDNPQVVQKFINAMASGWKGAAKEPRKAIDYLKEYDKTVDANREIRSLEKSLEYFAGYQGKVLALDPAAWDQTVSNLKDLGVLKATEFSSSVNMSFVENYHRTNK